MTVSPASDPDLFWATAGGMGLTGVITRATIQMIPVETSYMLVDTERADDLDDGDGQDAHRRRRLPLLGGLDRLPVDGRPARPIGADPGRPRPARRAARPAPSSPPTGPRAFAPRTLVRVPVTPPGGLLNPLTVGAFNEVWFRKAPRHQVGKPHPWPASSTPSTGSAAWNRLYGPRGFLQYQFVVPDEQGETVRRVIERLARAQAGFVPGRAQAVRARRPGPLSFPMPGWTLALDLPVGTRGSAACSTSSTTRWSAAGGRVYLAKDSRVSPAAFRAMYPGVDEWLAVRDRVDPDGVLRSDLGSAPRPVPRPAARRRPVPAGPRPPGPPPARPTRRGRPASASRPPRPLDRTEGPS